MKTDYELAEKIGANCYMICDDGGVVYYKIEENNIYLYSHQVGEMHLAPLSIHEVVRFGVKPIPPKPQVLVEYEKVNESIFDLKDEFERGELYYSALSEGGEFVKITPNTSMSESYLVGNFQSNNLYRRIEKPVDWRDEVVSYVNNLKYATSKNGINHSSGEGIISGFDFENLCYAYDEEFLEMCRVALRANGEL